jgi:hypothetical protein
MADSERDEDVVDWLRYNERDLPSTRLSSAKFVSAMMRISKKRASTA